MTFSVGLSPVTPGARGVRLTARGRGVLEAGRSARSSLEDEVVLVQVGPRPRPPGRFSPQCSRSSGWARGHVVGGCRCPWTVHEVAQALATLMLTGTPWASTS